MEVAGLAFRAYIKISYRPIQDEGYAWRLFSTLEAAKIILIYTSIQVDLVLVMTSKLIQPRSGKRC